MRACRYCSGLHCNYAFVHTGAEKGSPCKQSPADGSCVEWGAKWNGEVERSQFALTVAVSERRLIQPPPFLPLTAADFE